MGGKAVLGLRRRRAPGEERRGGDPLPRIPSSLPLESGTRVYGAAGWSPARFDRGARRSARQVELEYRKRLMDQRRAEIEALRQEERERPFLARGGEPGPMAGRSYRRLRLVPHRATSEVLAGAYPFLAEEGLGSRVSDRWTRWLASGSDPSDCPRRRVSSWSGTSLHAFKDLRSVSYRLVGPVTT
jgi:hypothetical protein